MFEAVTELPTSRFLSPRAQWPSPGSVRWIVHRLLVRFEIENMFPQRSGRLRINLTGSFRPSGQRLCCPDQTRDKDTYLTFPQQVPQFLPKRLALFFIRGTFAFDDLRTFLETVAYMFDIRDDVCLWKLPLAHAGPGKPCP